MKNPMIEQWFTTIETGICEILSKLSSLTNSNLFSIIVSTLVAAFAGAYGAQYIVERNRKKELLEKEIRNTNATIMIALSISNTCLSLKKQHIKDLKEDFIKAELALDTFEKRLNEGKIQQSETFETVGSLEKLPYLSIPSDLLENKIFEHISLSGRALSITIALISAIQSLNRAIEQRNELIQNFKNIVNPTQTNFILFYFGKPDNNGNIDRSYPDSIEAIYKSTDDCIFYSMLLSEALNKHGKNLKKQLGNKKIIINKGQFQEPKEMGLMPNEEDYADWLSMFQSK